MYLLKFLSGETRSLFLRFLKLFKPFAFPFFTLPLNNITEFLYFLLCKLSILFLNPGAYISEIAHPDFRATLASFPGFALSVGLSLVWVLGYFFTWQTMAYLAIIPPSLLIILLLYLPESPYWLVKAEKYDLAKKSLRFYRDFGQNIDEEFDEIYQKNLQKKNEFRLRKRNFAQFLRAFFRPFMCVGVLWILNMWSGYPALSVYLMKIMKASGSTIDPALGNMYFFTILPLISRSIPAFPLTRIFIIPHLFLVLYFYIAF